MVFLQYGLRNITVKGVASMDYKDWLIMKALDDTGSITPRRRRAVRITAGLSKRIHLLEDEFRSQLVIRSSSGVTLKAAGRCLADYSREMLLQLQQLKDNIEELGRTAARQYPNRGTQYVLPAGPSAGSEDFYTALPQHQPEHPKRFFNRHCPVAAQRRGADRLSARGI